MSDIICVTNRRLCSDFLGRMEAVAAAGPSAVILREKDMKEEEYEALAARVIEICGENGVLCILHSFVNAAKRLSCRRLHMPLEALEALSEEERLGFDVLGASCHSAGDAVRAEALGCTYVTAGHIFDTDSKKGTPGRGLDFLEKVCDAVDIPVYAIGGIGPDNIRSVLEAGAAGACVMSGLMTCDDAGAYMDLMKEESLRETI